jgi:predicted transcriptional regulator
MTQTAELTQVATRIDDDQLRRLDEVCDARKRSRSFVLAEALDRLLEAATADRQPVETGKAA